MLNERKRLWYALSLQTGLCRQVVYQIIFPPTPAKVTAIQNWLEPWNVHDVQSFLGFANFYCCFIADYSQLTLLLMNLCKKATPWNFSKREATAFSTAPVLCHWVPDLWMMVETDASNHMIAGILLATTKDNEIQPSGFLLLLITRGGKELQHS